MGPAIWSMGSRTQQATPVDAVGRVSTDSPGSEVASSLTRRMRGNQGDPSGGAPEGAHPRTSLNSEEEGGVWRKSETPIVAMRSEGVSVGENESEKHGPTLSGLRP